MLKVIIFSGYGLNCEEETKFAFSLADRSAIIDTLHINDLISRPELLSDYQIMVIPGGFSYGDHTGAGNAFSWHIKNNLIDAINKFRQQDKLILGICNGCQILVKLFPEDFPVDLYINDSSNYQCEWVNLISTSNNNIWCKGINKIRIPIAHGEGKFQIHNDTINVAMKYTHNPNGSDLDAAALSSQDGRILAMMPHPERAVLFTQQDQWPLLKEKYKRHGEPIPKYGDGISIFKNAIDYFL